MKFQDVFPSSPRGNGYAARVPLTAAAMTTAEACRSMKPGSLHLNGAPQSNALYEIAQELALARRFGEKADGIKFGDRGFPFQIEAYTFPNGHSGPLRDGQNRLAVVMPLGGLLSKPISQSRSP